MPLASLTEEERRRKEGKIEDKTAEVDYLKTVTPKEMWLIELEKLRPVLESTLKEIEHPTH